MISVDAKKKELIGQYANKGRTWRPVGDPHRVDVHDFPGEAGKAVPYGVYDLAADAGWVSVGCDGDTATWLPPNKSYRCRFVARQVAVKAKWGLWVTAAERDAMRRVLSKCPEQPAPA